MFPHVLVKRCSFFCQTVGFTSSSLSSPPPTEPRRDPDLCKHFAANQPDTSPCSQCVSGHLRGEVTVFVCARMCVFVCVCVLPPPGEEDGVCMCVSPCYVSGLDEVTGFRVQLVACVCTSVLLYIRVCVHVWKAKTDSPAVLEHTWTRQQFESVRVTMKQMPGRTTVHTNFWGTAAAVIGICLAN